MTITLHWWIFPIGLFLFPFAYRLVKPYQDTGGYFGSMDLEGMLLGIVCWAIAIGLFIGHWI
ncbi:MAG: hypothetical protein ABSA86_15305 [Oryzomonas sp.]